MKRDFYARLVLQFQLILLLATCFGCAHLAGEPAPAEPPIKLERIANSDHYGDPLPPAAIARLGSNRLMAEAAVLDMLILGDNATLITTDGESMIWWKMASGEPMQRLTGYPLTGQIAAPMQGTSVAAAGSDGVYLFQNSSANSMTLLAERSKTRQNAVAFTADGQTLVSGGDSGRVLVWDAQSGKALHEREGHQVPVTAVAVSAPNNLIASGDATGKIRLWDLTTGASKGAFDGSSQMIHDLFITPDGKTIIVCDGSSNVVGLNRSGTPRYTVKGHNNNVIGLRMNPEGSLAATFSDRKTLFWNPNNGKVSKQHDAGGPVALSPSGHVFGVANGPLINLRLVRTGQELLLLDRHTTPISKAQFSSDGRAAFTLGSVGDIRLWNAATGQQLAGLNSKAVTVVPSPNGRTLAIPEGNTIRMLDMTAPKASKTKNRIITGFPAAVQHIVFSQNNAVMAAIVADRGLTLITPTTGQINVRLPNVPIRNKGVAISNDGALFAIANGTTVEIRTTKAARDTLQTLDTGPISKFAFSPKNNLLATLAPDSSTVRFWPLTSPKPILPTPPPSTEPTPPPTEGTFEIGPEAKPVPQTAPEVQLLVEPPVPPTPVATDAPEPPSALALPATPTTMAWHADNTRLAFGFDTGTVEFWNRKTQTQTLRFQPHQSAITALQIDAPGHKMLTASADTTSMIWNLAQLTPAQQLVAGESIDNGLPSGVIGLFGSADLRHDKAISAMALSPDGYTIAIGSEDGALRLWNSNTGVIALELKEHVGTPTAIAFSHDGSQIAAAGSDNKVHLWTVIDGLLVRSFPFTATVRSIAFHYTKPEIAIAGDTTSIVLFDTQTGSIYTTLKSHRGHVNDIAYAPNGKRLASASDDGEVIVWHLFKVKPLLRIDAHKKGATSVAFSSDNKVLATGGKGGKVYTWDVLITGNKTQTLAGFSTQQKLQFSSNNSKLASIGPGYALMWDVADAKLVHNFSLNTSKTNAMALSPNDVLMFTASGERAPRMWDLNAGSERLDAISHSAPLRTVAADSSGRLVATASEDTTIILWDAVTRKPKQILRGHTAPVNMVLFSQTSPHLLSTGDDDTVQVWSTETGKRQSKLKAHNGKINAIAIAQDGQSFATGGADGDVRVYNTATSHELARIPGNGRPITALTFSRNGRIVLFATDDGLIRGWSSASYETVISLRGHTTAVSHLEYSPRAEVLASADISGQIRIWNVSKRSIAQTFRAKKPHAIAWTSDAKLLASVDDEMVHLWDPVSGKDPLQLRDFPGTLNGLAFSPKGDRLYTTNDDTNALIWRLKR